MGNLTRSLAILFAAFTPCFAQGDEILFIVNAPGDANVVRAIAPRVSHYKIFAFGGAIPALEGERHVIAYHKKIDGRDLTVEEWKRDWFFPSSEIEKIITQFNPDVVISGMFSRFQGHLCVGFKGKGARVYAVYDNFDPLTDTKGGPYGQPFFEAIQGCGRQPVLDGYFIPVESSRSSFEAMYPKAPIYIMGHPTMPTVRRIFDDAKAKNLRKVLNIPQGDKVVVFAGGSYVDGYKESFAWFVDAVKNLKGVQVHITRHPRFDGSAEIDVLERVGERPHIHLWDPRIDLTFELASIADMVVCHKSTAGYQMACMDVPVMFLANAAYGHRNGAILSGSAFHGTTDLECLMRIQQMKKGTLPPLAKLGLPDNSVDRILSVLSTQEKKI